MDNIVDKMLFVVDMDSAMKARGRLKDEVLGQSDTSRRHDSSNPAPRAAGLHGGDSRCRSGMKHWRSRQTLGMVTPPSIFHLESGAVLENYGKAGHAKNAHADSQKLARLPMLAISSKPSGKDWNAFQNLSAGKMKEAIIAINKLLTPFGLHFGYRVANEIASFVSLAPQHTDGFEQSLWSALLRAGLQPVAQMETESECDTTRHRSRQQFSRPGLDPWPGTVPERLRKSGMSSRALAETIMEGPLDEQRR